MLRRLILKPRAGLCNRLRAIAAGRRLCERIGARLTLVWDWGDPSDLFDCTGFDVINRAPSGVPIVHQSKEDVGPRRVDYNSLPAEVVLDTCYVFFGEDDDALGGGETNVAPWLPRAAPALADRAASLTSGWSDDVLGVHIRAPDHNKPGPTLDVLWHLYRPHIDRWRGRVFLSSNDARVEERAQVELPRLVCVPKLQRHQPPRWPRKLDHAANVEDMIDLLLLSACHHVVGAAWSSFSRLAAIYGDTFGRLVSVELP